MANKVLIKIDQFDCILQKTESEHRRGNNLNINGVLKDLFNRIPNKSGGTTIFWNANGTAIGYGGYFYEELCWLSLSLNFRYLYALSYTFIIILLLKKFIFQKYGYVTK